MEKHKLYELIQNAKSLGLRKYVNSPIADRDKAQINIALYDFWANRGIAG